MARTRADKMIPSYKEVLLAMYDVLVTEGTYCNVQKDLIRILKKERLLKFNEGPMFAILKDGGIIRRDSRETGLIWTAIPPTNSMVHVLVSRLRDYTQVRKERIEASIIAGESAPKRTIDVDVSELLQFSTQASIEARAPEVPAEAIVPDPVTVPEPAKPAKGPYKKRKSTKVEEPFFPLLKKVTVLHLCFIAATLPFLWVFWTYALGHAIGFCVPTMTGEEVLSMAAFWVVTLLCILVGMIYLVVEWIKWGKYK